MHSDGWQPSAYCYGRDNAAKSTLRHRKLHHLHIPDGDQTLSGEELAGFPERMVGT